MTMRIDTLSEIETRLWLELQQAADTRGHDWRTMTLATHDGAMAHARTIVLREVDAKARALVFFSDARSAKVAQMRAHELGTLLCWSAGLGWQLRLSVRLAIETDGLAVSSRWARLKLSPAAQDYLSPLPPGSTLDGVVEPQRASRHHFAVVTAQVDAIDWLELHAEGQRRACFDAKGASWLQP
jgi:hypothetical protein